MEQTDISWVPVLKNDIPLQVMLNTLPTKGNLVYEYNPFRNYRMSENKYWYLNGYYSLKELEDEFKIKPNEYNTGWEGLPQNVEAPILYEKGQLVDFITDEFKLSLDHPVHIIPQASYDGSVNLIINDGLNVPRLINSRFSATGKNTYEIVDRKGNNDTNIYDSGELFDIDTSLYKIVNNIPKVTFLGTKSGGNLKVGNYHFYFKLADSDGNETDFIAESGLVSVFIGENSYHSVHTGTKNENSTKQVEFLLTNIDAAYDYIIVYFSRNTAELGDNRVTEYVKINKKYNRNSTKLIITGFEEFENVSATDINLFYNLVDAAQTSAVCLNMLFLGNVKKQEIPYKDLLDLSLHILPKLGIDNYNTTDPEYYIQDPKKSYINERFIYDKTGYWPNELYRFGIVYILPNGQLTPVFNVRGGTEIFNNSTFTKFNVFEDEEKTKRKYIKYNEKTNYITDIEENKGSVRNENVKGVCSFSDEGRDCIHYVSFEIPDEVKEELKKYVKGYFFVRLPRIPLVLALGITIGIDNEARIPTIPTKDGILAEIENSLSDTHVETDDIRGVNYISEGFLKRYSFTFKAKSSNLWGKIGKIAGMAALVVGGVAAGLVSGGTGFLASLAVVQSITAAVGTTGAAIAVGAAGAAAGAIAGTIGTAYVAGYQELGLAIKRVGDKKTLNGKATKAPSGYELKETESSRTLTEDFLDRIIIKDGSKNKVLAIICPDYTLNLPYYNLIFTGNEHIIEVASGNNTNNYFENDGHRHFYISNSNYDDNQAKIQTNVKIIGVADDITCIGIDKLLFRSRAGEDSEAWRYRQIGEEITDSKNKKINTDIVRGCFSPYLACTNTKIDAAKIVNIYIPGYDSTNMEEYIEIRMNDNSAYNAITDRIDINYYESKVGNTVKNEPTRAYRGDCYICQYTQRINRNFNDPTAPYNNEIIDINTWKNNYDPDNVESYEKINLGDINAVLLGMWVTFLLRSSNNLNIRTLDSSWIDEKAMTGHARGYYPYYPMSTEGVYKIPESLIYNKGFAKSLSDRWNVGVPDVPYVKDWFGTRIMYSDIHVNDGYKNGFRVFLGTHYRDYTREYGEIVKLISLESSLLCVFEHGIALIPVNERTVAGQGAGGNVYINTSNVLPENPKIISDMFGSQWPESVLKVPGKTGDAPQYVYGVDTIAKKIWRTDGNSIECISDSKVQEFLNNNITLGERELTPKIGIRNVKTHYNAFKRDVMFTFYDNTYGFEEKVWNLCWNELLLRFITFYSWVPSYMENINNIPFSFNRDTSKWIAKLGTSHTENSFADGITLNNVIVGEQNKDIYIKYIKEDGTEGVYKHTLNINDDKFIGALSLSNRVLPDETVFYTIKYDLVRDNYGNYKMFEIPETPIAKIKIKSKGLDKPKFTLEIPIYGLFLKSGYTKKDLYSELYYRNSAGHSYADYDTNKTSYLKAGIEGVLSYPIFKDITGKRPTLPREDMLNPDKIVTLLNIKASIQIISSNDQTNLSEDYYNLKAGFESGTTLVDAGYYESVVAITPRWNLLFLSTDFWKHGQAGLIDIADDIYPTYWYGKQHPFEFECVVVNDPSVHKIFDNLELVANKAKPESFHYEIIGESYDFAKDKPNMYFRQEARKALWQYNGADICYDPNFVKVKLKQLHKSADLPHKYYSRKDTINEIEDYYITTSLNIDKYDYKHLAGAEIVHYPNRQEFRIWNHAPAIAMSDLLDTTNHWDQSNGITVLKPYSDDRNLEDVYKGITNAKSYSGGRSIIGANCEYLEDRWKIQINPIIICYKNEYDNSKTKTYLFSKENSTWANNKTMPKIPIYNSPIPEQVIKYTQGDLLYPFRWEADNSPVEYPSENSLCGLYGEDEKDLLKVFDEKSWLNDVGIYNTSFGEALNRKELDIRDKFMKVRIRYSGEELAVIDFLNTIYRVSYS